MNQPHWPVLPWVTRALVGVGALVAAVLIVVFLYRTAPAVEQVARDENIPSVLAFRTREVPVQRQWRGYGTAQAVSAANVPARITATVADIPQDIDAGRTVTRGQLLVQLDPTDFQIQVEVAEQALAELEAQIASLGIEEQRLTERLDLEAQDLALAQNELERIQRLIQTAGANPQEEENARRTVLASEQRKVQLAEQLDRIVPRRIQLQAQKTAQESNLRQARQNLERTRITSPIDGVIQSLDVEIGENVSAGERIARVVALDRIEVPLRLPADARNDATVGDPVELATTTANPDRWTARITRVAPEIDPETRTITTYAEIHQPDIAGRFGTEQTATLLAPGTFVEGTVNTGLTQPRIVVPRRAIQSGRVWVIEDGVLRSRNIEIAYAMEAELPELQIPDRQWAVLDNALAPGELIVVNPTPSLFEGELVQPQIANDPTDDAPQQQAEATR